MAFTQYFVIGNSINIHPGMQIKDMTDDQLRRRKNLVKELKKGIHECIFPFCFKRGEVVTLDISGYSKACLKILKEPETIEVEKTVEEKPALEDLSKAQLIAYAETKKKCKKLELNMKMNKVDIISAILEAMAKPDQA